LEQMDRARIRWTEKDGLQSAVLDELQMYQFLETMQGDRRAHGVQLPKITLYEGQVARDFGVGLQASCLPTISADRRHITVQTEIWLAKEKPSLNEQALAFAAKVPDRTTVAILAEKIVSEERRVEVTPMSRIPYVGRMFRNVGYGRDTMAKIVLLTPRIIREQEAEVVEVQPLRSGIQPQKDGKFPLIRSEGGK
jgi:hypothetical protein